MRELYLLALSDPSLCGKSFPQIGQKPHSIPLAGRLAPSKGQNFQSLKKSRLQSGHFRLCFCETIVTCFWQCGQVNVERVSWVERLYVRALLNRSLEFLKIVPSTGTPGIRVCPSWTTVPLDEFLFKYIDSALSCTELSWKGLNCGWEGVNWCESPSYHLLFWSK